MLAPRCACGRVHDDALDTIHPVEPAETLTIDGCDFDSIVAKPFRSFAQIVDTYIHLCRALWIDHDGEFGRFGRVQADFEAMFRRRADKIVVAPQLLLKDFVDRRAFKSPMIRTSPSFKRSMTARGPVTLTLILDASGSTSTLSGWCSMRIGVVKGRVTTGFRSACT